MKRPFCTIAALLLAVAPASAQPKATFAPPKNGVIDNVSLIAAHQSRWAALSETHRLLAFCHESSYPDSRVSLVKLDAKGLPAPYLTQLKLPKPDGLVKFANYALAAAFHPRLPLLYVWQDVNLHYTNPPSNEPADLKNFDHLVIFDLAREPAEVVATLCRGKEYIYGQSGGGLAVDGDGGFLYVPNLRELTNAGSFRFGRFPLAADGLPEFADKDAKQPLAVRGKRLSELNAANPVSPADLTPIEYVNLFPATGYGSASCFIPLNKDVVIAGGHGGAMAWRPQDKVATLSGLPFRHSGPALLGLHPTLPAAYATVHRHDQTNSLFRFEQVEGYLSSLPRQYLMPGGQVSGPPLVMAKGKKLAVGGHHFVYLIDLDEGGFPHLDGGIQMQVLNPLVRAMVYSEKFDRLYVGVEVSK